MRPYRIQTKWRHPRLSQQKRHSGSGQKSVEDSLGEELFVGLWKDRDDLSDATAWVRRLREQEWRP